MSEIKQQIGYVKAVQRSIGSDVAKRLFEGGLRENSAEFRASQLIYEFTTHLRYLMQLAEDENWTQILASQGDKAPIDPSEG